MPRQSHKTTKRTPAHLMRTPAKDSSCLPLSATFSENYSTLKRTQLQQQCKKLGLRAVGKNVELIKRLEAYHEESSLKIACNKKETKKWEDNLGTLGQTSPPNMTKDIKTEIAEDETGMVRGWCVVHGMVLHCPASDWVPLLLHRGLVCVQDGENMVPFHLPSLNISVPEGLSDNYVCRDCVLRNREEPKKCPMCQQIQSPLKNLFPLMKTSSSSLLATDGCKEKRSCRTVKFKRYRPQEDKFYAQRVDGLLSQIAMGKVGMDEALGPCRSLVVHSPAPFKI